MHSTRTGRYAASWRTHSTGPLKHDVRGINLITKGRAMAGAFIGDVTGTTGSIGTAEIATSAVTTPKIRAQAVTSTKLGAGAVMASNTGVVETISTADTTLTNNGLALLTKSTTIVLAVTIPPPTNGVMKAIHNDSTEAVGFTLTCSTTTVTFDGSNKIATFNALSDSVLLMGSGTTRWVIIANNSVTLS